MSDSTSHDYIRPLVTDGLHDADLDDAFQQFIVGLTGMDPTLVRPRWQPQPPTQPDPSIDWISVGVIQQTPLDFPVLQHDGTEPGLSTLTKWEQLDVLISAYGPNSGRYLSMIRDGAYIDLNSFELTYQWHIRVQHMSTPIMQVPELINTQWVPRHDLHAMFVREIQTVYPIRSIVGAEVPIQADRNDDSDNAIQSTVVINVNE